MAEDRWFSDPEYRFDRVLIRNGLTVWLPLNRSPRLSSCDGTALFGACTLLEKQYHQDHGGLGQCDCPCHWR